MFMGRRIETKISEMTEKSVQRFLQADAADRKFSAGVQKNGISALREPP